jgi:hypothetical protein
MNKKQRDQPKPAFSTPSHPARNPWRRRDDPELAAVHFSNPILGRPYGPDTIPIELN